MMLKKYIFALVIALILTQAESSASAYGAVKLRPVVEPNKQVLVLPFSYAVQKDCQNNPESILQALAAHITASLRAYGIGAEQYSDATLPAAAPEQMPEQAQEQEQEQTQEEQKEQTKQEEQAPEQTQTLAQTQVLVHGPAQPADLSILEKAKNSGYAYVLTGNIIFLQSEIKPAVQTGTKKMSSARARISCSFRLTTTDGSIRSISGMSDGKAGKSFILDGGAQDQTLLDNNLSLVLNQAVIAVAQNTARKLANPESSDYEAGKTNAYGAGDVQPDKEYYQDSPGKKLKPEK